MLAQRESVDTSQGLAFPTSSSSRAPSQEGTGSPGTPIAPPSLSRWTFLCVGHRGGESIGLLLAPDSMLGDSHSSASGVGRLEAALSVTLGSVYTARHPHASLSVTMGKLKGNGEPRTIVWVPLGLPAGRTNPAFLLPWQSHPARATPAAD